MSDNTHASAAKRLRELHEMTNPAPKEKTVSADCREGAHWWCSGRRWVNVDGNGRNVYAKCGCSCHRSKSEQKEQSRG